MVGLFLPTIPLRFLQSRYVFARLNLLLRLAQPELVAYGRQRNN
jgi:hypothetical protein